MSEAVLLKRPSPPADFEAFWQAVVAENETLSLVVERVHIPDDDLPTHRVERVRWLGADGKGREGWLAVPKTQPKPMPAVLYLPGYGVSTVPIGENTAFEQHITFSINLHGYAVVPNVPYSPELGYFTQGIETPQTYVYRRIMLDCLLAMRVLASLPEVDANQLVVAGRPVSRRTRCARRRTRRSSPGSWSPRRSARSASRYLLVRPAWRYPLKEFSDYCEAHKVSSEQLLATLQYFDGVNHAPYVRVPTQLSLALKDPGIRAPVVFSLYDALPQPKRLLIYEELGHDWTPEMRPRLEEWAEWAYRSNASNT